MKSLLKQDFARQIVLEHSIMEEGEKIKLLYNGINELPKLLVESHYDHTKSLRRIEEFNILTITKDFYCGASCVRMILAYNGIQQSEKEISYVGYKVEKEFKSLEGNDHKMQNEGVGSKGFMEMIRHYKMHGFIIKGKNNDTPRENLEFFLSNDIPVILSWKTLRLNEREGHYSVATGFTHDGSNLIFADPEDEIMRAAKFDVFKSRWYDPSPYYNKWMLAVYPDRSFNKEIIKAGMKGKFV